MVKSKRRGMKFRKEAGDREGGACCWCILLVCGDVGSRVAGSVFSGREADDPLFSSSRGLDAPCRVAVLCPAVEK